MSQRTLRITILNKQKCHFFSFEKSVNRGAEQVLSFGLVPVGGEKMLGKCIWGWIQHKYCVHKTVNGKMIPDETLPGMGGVEW
jgi:hypothetical protein